MPPFFQRSSGVYWNDIAPGGLSPGPNKIYITEFAMSSSWEPAVAQAMQRHGGSNRSLPRTVQSRLSLKETPNESAVAGTSTPEAVAPPVAPEHPLE
jgi:hypothetical protein